MIINNIVVDSTNSVTDLCMLGTLYPTDKSPYNKNDNLHKHAYTSIYNLLFSSMRYKTIKLGEIGILDNNSMKMWRKYFPYAELHGYEWSDDYLKKATSDNLPNTFYTKMDVTDKFSIEKEFNNILFDVLIDDSTHKFEDQINLINVACKYMNVGGILIIEDIFTNFDQKQYEDSIDHLKEYFSTITFIETNHLLKYSPGWNNDKLLILFRNNIPYNDYKISNNNSM